LDKCRKPSGNRIPPLHENVVFAATGSEKEKRMRFPERKVSIHNIKKKPKYQVKKRGQVLFSHDMNFLKMKKSTCPFFQ
jgi:hypothetical protein